MLESLTRIHRAFSGSLQMREVAAFSTLKRKCGLIWLRSASKRACTAAERCSSRSASTRVLFHILSGMPTHTSVVSQTQSVTQK